MFERQVIFNNSLQSISIVCSIVLCMLITKRFFSNTLAGILYHLIQLKWKSVSKPDFLRLLGKPLGWFIFITASIVSFDTLTFPNAWQHSIYGHPVDQLVHDIGSSLVVVFFTRLVLRFIDFLALVMEANALRTPELTDNQVIVFFRDFLKAAIFLFGVLGVFSTLFKINISSVLTGLSIVGAALALAAKESIENIIASFIIFFDKPFFTGEKIQLNDLQGDVEQIGLRSTRIRTTHHTLVTIPNKQLVDGIVDNLSKRTRHRIEWKIELAHENSASSLKQLIIELTALFQIDANDSQHAEVHLSEISKNGLILSIEIDVPTMTSASLQKKKQEILLAIKTTFENLQIKSLEITSPSTDKTRSNP